MLRLTIKGQKSSLVEYIRHLLLMESHNIYLHIKDKEVSHLISVLITSKPLQSAEHQFCPLMPLKGP